MVGRDFEREILKTLNCSQVDSPNELAKLIDTKVHVILPVLAEMKRERLVVWKLREHIRIGKRGVERLNEYAEG